MDALWLLDALLVQEFSPPPLESWNPQDLSTCLSSSGIDQKTNWKLILSKKVDFFIALKDVVRFLYHVWCLLLCWIGLHDQEVRCRLCLYSCDLWTLYCLHKVMDRMYHSQAMHWSNSGWITVMYGLRLREFVSITITHLHRHWPSLYTSLSLSFLNVHLQTMLLGW